MSQTETLEVDGILKVGGEVLDSPAGGGKLSGLSEDGCPRVNGYTVAWLLCPQGLYDPTGVAPKLYKKEGVAGHQRRLAQKPRVQAIMDLARRFRSASGVDYDEAYKKLERLVYELSTAEQLPVTPS